MREDGKVLLIADECHRYGSTSWSRVLQGSYRRRLGLTATFERNDDGLTRLLSYFGGSPVFHIGFKRAIRDGVVAPYDVALVGVDLDVHERRNYDEVDEVVRDCRAKLLAAGFTSNPFGTLMAEVIAATNDQGEDPTVSEIASRYLWAFARRVEILCEARAKLTVLEELIPRINASRGTIVFTRQIDSAMEMAALLLEHGVAAESIHSKLSRGERHDRLARLKRGRTKVVVAPTILDEGIDVPDVDLGIVTAGSRSRRQMIQRMGRILRLKPDGRAASFIVLYARNTLEDMSISDGQESCLDLIIGSARHVRDGLVVKHEKAAQRTKNGQLEPDREFDRDVATAVAVSAEAVWEYQRIHDVDGEMAKRAISRLLLDLADTSVSTTEEGTVLIETRGVELRLDPGFRGSSATGDCRKWNPVGALRSRKMGQRKQLRPLLKWKSTMSLECARWVPSTSFLS